MAEAGIERDSGNAATRVRIRNELPMDHVEPQHFQVTQRRKSQNFPKTILERARAQVRIAAKVRPSYRVGKMFAHVVPCEGHGALASCSPRPLRARGEDDSLAMRFTWSMRSYMTRRGGAEFVAARVVSGCACKAASARPRSVNIASRSHLTR